VDFVYSKIITDLKEVIRMIIIDENSETFEHTCKNNPNEVCYACMLESELKEQDINTK
jgi:hypothetical protein